MQPKQFKLWNVFVVLVVSVLISGALFHAMCHLKATQMNLEYSLIWELNCG